jgi:hypothetical protein
MLKLSRLYPGSVNLFDRLALLLCVLSFVRAADLKPETAAAFDHYVKLTEEANEKLSGSGFLRLDQDKKQKNLVWLGQTVIEPKKTLDHDQEIDVPDGLLQDWIGEIYLESATLERVRDMLLNFADYKTYFKQQINESRLVKRDGDHFDAFLRFYKRQVAPMVLNTQLSSVYTSVDPSRAYILNRSTHIGEAAHPGKKQSYDQERSSEEAAGYLWRLNFYWRLHQADDGVYAELELISLSRPGGGLRPGRFLSGFEGFPREIVECFLDGLRTAFPRRH